METNKSSKRSVTTKAGTPKISPVKGANTKSSSTRTTGDKTGSGILTDQERITDLMFCEKKMQANYSAFASECVDAKLRDEFLKLMNKSHLTQSELRDEFLKLMNKSHLTQSELFSQAQMRGWYKPKAASAAEMKQAYQKFSSM
jgi:Coat F domain.